MRSRPPAETTSLLYGPHDDRGSMRRETWPGALSERPSPVVAGVVLAGGLSRRMGRDKAQVVLRGRTLLARTCERLAPQCASLAISRHTSTEPHLDIRYPTIEDGTAGRAGPLAGILAALEWCAVERPGATHVLSVAVDTPFLPCDLTRRLIAARDVAGAAIACAASGGRLHPVAALWPVALRGALRDCLISERISRVVSVLERLGYTSAEWPSVPHDPFFNLNAPEDVVLADAIAASLDGTGSQ